MTLRISLGLLGVLSLLVGYAQPTIYNSHYFAPGLTVNYQPTPDSLVTYDEQGTDLVWDYRHLTAQGKAYRRDIKVIEDTPDAARFPEANVAIAGEGGDHVYLKVQNDRTDFIAFVPPDTSYRVFNYQPWSISIHPLNLGDTLLAPAARVIETAEGSTYRTGHVRLVALASGRLLLPNQTYEEVLKIKEVQTFYNPARGSFYEATTYHWLSNRCNFPVLSCNDILNRSSDGTEQRNRFAQYLLSEEGTQQNTRIINLDRARKE